MCNKHLGDQGSATGVFRAALCALAGVVMGFLLAGQHLPLSGVSGDNHDPQGKPATAPPVAQTLTRTVTVGSEQPVPVRKARPERKPTPAPRQPQPAVQEDPFDHNCALAEHGTTVKGGVRSELLIDGKSTSYDGSLGFAYTTWTTKPPQRFVITLKQPMTLNVVRFLLWDKDSRFYRYTLEASADVGEPGGDRWIMLADRSMAPSECRGWQVILFKPCTIARLRLTGTYNSANSGFHVVELQAYHIPGGLEFPWVEPEF